MNLRTYKTKTKYVKYLKLSKNDTCFLCKRLEGKIIKSYKYWKIILNNFPYDKIASKHDLLVLKRHATSLNKLTPDELDELIKIKKNIHSTENYSTILENTAKQQSVKKHYHLHLLELLD